MVATPLAKGDTVDAGRGVLLATATLSQFGASVTQQGTLVLGVFFASTYALGLGTMGALLSAMTLGWVVSGLFVGLLVDRYGPRRVLMIGTILLTIFATAVGITANLSVTVVLLFVLGLALGSVPLSGTKAILMAWPRERRGLPMGIRQMGVPLGAMAAALVLPLLATRFGLHPLYWGFAALLAICGFSFAVVLPSQWSHIPQARAYPPTRLRAEASRLIVPSISGFLMSWGQYSLMTFSIPLLHGDLGVSLAIAGLLLAAAQAGGAVARIVLGALSDKLGARRDVVLIGCSTAGAALACLIAWLSHAPGHTVSVALLAPLWILAGAAMVGWNALMLTWAGERVSVGNAGAAMGLTTSAILSGATICSPAFGFIVEASGSYTVAWLTLAGILGLAALLLWIQSRFQRPRSPALLPEEAPFL